MFSVFRVTPLRMSRNFTSEIRKLREITAAPLSDCLEAIKETNGSITLAQYVLEKKCLAHAITRPKRDTKYSSLVSCVENSYGGAILTFSAETDFTTRNMYFLKAAKELQFSVNNLINQSKGTILGLEDDHRLREIQSISHSTLMRVSAILGEKIAITHVDVLPRSLMSSKDSILPPNFNFKICQYTHCANHVPGVGRFIALVGIYLTDMSSELTEEEMRRFAQHFLVNIHSDPANLMNETLHGLNKTVGTWLKSKSAIFESSLLMESGSKPIIKTSSIQNQINCDLCGSFSPA